MVTVTGMFEVRLRKSIDVSLEFLKPASDRRMKFEESGSKIELAPGQVEPPTEIEGEYLEGPCLSVDSTRRVVASLQSP